ncbi:MAG TPA: hypothetical protein ENK55_10415 [Actinobacteria bacterium]|nr:hypothetical protein [Actinomycetota bacterium]
MVVEGVEDGEGPGVGDRPVARHRHPFRRRCGRGGRRRRRGGRGGRGHRGRRRRRPGGAPGDDRGGDDDGGEAHPGDGTGPTSTAMTGARDRTR